MRILIIEDEIIIARFIEQQLTANFDCRTSIALNREEVEATLPDFLPHLILCDINLMEESDGITLVENLRQQYAFEVIFITSYQSRTIIERALQYRPLNYVMKPADESAVFTAVKLAWPVISNNPTLGKPLDSVPPDRLLTAAERKIVGYILQHKTSREIATLLFLSPSTIKNHRHSICRKLGLKDGNNALLKWALQHRDRLTTFR